MSRWLASPGGPRSRDTRPRRKRGHGPSRRRASGPRRLRPRPLPGEGPPLAAEAAAGGARLIVFPEAFLSGYPRGLDFGARVGSRTPEGRELFRRHWESAVEIPGPVTAAIGDSAREARAHLVVGVVERERGTLYCSALFFAPDGRLMGRHRKLMPTAAERLIWGSGDGSTMPVFETPIGRLGAAICWENYMPLLRMHLYAQGVELYCAPTADDRDSWQATVRHIALEGRCLGLAHY